MGVNSFKYNMKNTIYTMICEMLYNIQKKNYIMPKVEGLSETIEMFARDEKSCGRFGDGEIEILRGESIKFQEADVELAKRLKEILMLDENKTDFLVCIPDIFHGLDFCKKEAYDYHYNHLIRNYKIWYNSINHKRVYYNTFSSRFYSLFADKSHCPEMITCWKKIWEQKKVLFVEGEFSRLGVGNTLFDNVGEIKRILCPSQNAWRCYGDILKEVLSRSQESDLVLVALGPTATVLCYDLYENGIKALDIGHLDIELEWFRMGTEKRVAVQGKHVNEVQNEEYLNYDLKDEAYVKQIIARIQ